MNFPLELPVYRFLLWLVNTAGVGGIIALFVGGGSVTAYALVMRWIHKGRETDEADTYSYPTPALHSHEPEE